MASAALDCEFGLVIRRFVRIIKGKHINLSLEELYKLYIGKNKLNFFRSDNGYNNGTYRKIWFDGRDDNTHLMDILNSLQIDDNFAANIYERLAKQYAYRHMIDILNQTHHELLNYE